MTASRNNPGYLWIHNDSGGAAEVYLVDTTLSIVATYILPNATNRDWEDIAIDTEPDIAKNYIYTGGIGDNQERKKIKQSIGSKRLY